MEPFCKSALVLAVWRKEEADDYAFKFPALDVPPFHTFTVASCKRPKRSKLSRRFSKHCTAATAPPGLHSWGWFVPVLWGRLLLLSEPSSDQTPLLRRVNLLSIDRYIEAPEISRSPANGSLVLAAAWLGSRTRPSQRNSSVTVQQSDGPMLSATLASHLQAHIDHVPRLPAGRALRGPAERERLSTKEAAVHGGGPGQVGSWLCCSDGQRKLVCKCCAMCQKPGFGNPPACGPCYAASRTVPSSRAGSGSASTDAHSWPRIPRLARPRWPWHCCFWPPRLP